MVAMTSSGSGQEGRGSGLHAAACEVDRRALGSVPVDDLGARIQRVDLPRRQLRTLRDRFDFAGVLGVEIANQMGIAFGDFNEFGLWPFEQTQIQINRLVDLFGQRTPVLPSTLGGIAGQGYLTKHTATGSISPQQHVY